MTIPIIPGKKTEETAMTADRKVWEIIKNAGFELVADSGIIVKYVSF